MSVFVDLCAFLSLSILFCQIYSRNTTAKSAKQPQHLWKPNWFLFMEQGLLHSMETFLSMFIAAGCCLFVSQLNASTRSQEMEQESYTLLAELPVQSKYTN